MFGYFTENGQKIIEIIFVEKDILLGISPGYNMVECSGVLDTQWSGHKNNIAPQNLYFKT